MFIRYLFYWLIISSFLLENTHSFHTSDMAFNDLFQLSIRILWQNIAMAVTLETIQRFRLQRQHVQITSIVAVFTTVNVMGMDGP